MNLVSGRKYVDNCVKFKYNLNELRFATNACTRVGVRLLVSQKETKQEFLMEFRDSFKKNGKCSDTYIRYSAVHD